MKRLYEEKKGKLKKRYKKEIRKRKERNIKRRKEKRKRKNRKEKISFVSFLVTEFLFTFSLSDLKPSSLTL